MGKELIVPEETDETRVSDWEEGLPSEQDLTPLSIHLVPPQLASAFSISPRETKTMIDVHRASQHTIHNLTAQGKPYLSPPVHKSPKPFESDPPDKENCIMDLDSDEDVDSFHLNGEISLEDRRSESKRPRLVWTPQLHKRFVDVVAHLGTKNAVPKTIMQLMNVDGLTRENVASHLQKYRNHLKRMQGFPNEGSSSSDLLFVSNATQRNLRKEQPRPVMMVPMPVYAISLNNHRGGMSYGGFDACDSYGKNC